MTARGITRPRAVLLDLDDTILDSYAAREKSYRLLYEKHSAINERSSWPDALAYFRSFEANGLIDAEQMALGILGRWPGAELDPMRFADDLFGPVAENARCFDGILSFLGSMNAARIPWGIVTNGNQRQVVKLHASGLVDVVPFAVISMIFGANKPDPLIYHEAVRRLKASFPRIDDLGHSDILFVGDNPYTDITGAFGVGMRTAWLSHGNGYPSDAPKPDMIIDSVLELGVMLGLA